MTAEWTGKRRVTVSLDASERRGGNRDFVLLISVTLAYLATLGVNTTRIVIALLLRAHSMSIAGLSPAQIHHAEGIVVYFTSLCALYLPALASTCGVSTPAWNNMIAGATIQPS